MKKFSFKITIGTQVINEEINAVKLHTALARVGEQLEAKAEFALNKTTWPVGKQSIKIELTNVSLVQKKTIIPLQELKKGMRIELISAPKDPTLKSGMMGTITDIHIQSPPIQSQIWVKWDDGSHLALLHGMDEFKIIPSISLGDANNG